MIKLFYVEDEGGKVRFKDNQSIERFGGFDIKYLVYSGNAASAYFRDTSGNEIARVMIDLRYDREFLDVVKNTKNVLHPVNREEFFDWLKEHHPDIMTLLLWYV